MADGLQRSKSKKQTARKASPPISQAAQAAAEAAGAAGAAVTAAGDPEGEGAEAVVPDAGAQEVVA